MKTAHFLTDVTNASRNHKVLWKFGSLNHQATFANVAPLAGRPNAVVLRASRRVQVIVFDRFWDDPNWNRTKCREMKITFHNSLNRRSTSVKFFSESINEAMLSFTKDFELLRKLGRALWTCFEINCLTDFWILNERWCYLTLKNHKETVQILFVNLKIRNWIFKQL